MFNAFDLEEALRLLWPSDDEERWKKQGVLSRGQGVVYLNSFYDFRLQPCKESNLFESHFLHQIPRMQQTYSIQIVFLFLFQTQFYIILLGCFGFMFMMFNGPLVPVGSGSQSSGLGGRPAQSHRTMEKSEESGWDGAKPWNRRVSKESRKGLKTI